MVTLTRLVIHWSLVRFRSERFLVVFHSTLQRGMDGKGVCVHGVDSGYASCLSFHHNRQYSPDHYWPGNVKFLVPMKCVGLKTQRMHEQILGEHLWPGRVDFCIHSGPAVGTNQSKSGDRKTQECLPLGQPNNRKVIDVQVCQLDLGSSAPQDSPVWLDTSLPDKTRDEKEKTCAWALLTYIELTDQKPLSWKAVNPGQAYIYLPKRV